MTQLTTTTTRIRLRILPKGGLVTETTFNLDSPATSNNQYFILVRFYYSSNEYYVSPPGGDILFLSCPSQFVSATPLKLLNRISWNLVGSKDTICSCAYYQKIWSPKFCGSYAPLNLKISPNILLKQLVSATPLKLLNRISWNLVGSKDTICSCAYYQEMLIP